jgi:hypothetical protein
MNRFLEALVAKLPAAVQPYAKACVPLVLGAALVVQDLTVTAVEVDALKVAALSAAYSLAVLAVPALGYIQPQRGEVVTRGPRGGALRVEPQAEIRDGGPADH